MVLVIIVVWGCGQRGAPSGGDKDSTPPQVLKSTPDSAGTNFSGTELSWKFDEYVKVSGLGNELLISPPVRSKPKFKLVGKKLTLKFDTLLNPNTTYSVFLGKAIKDLNEGNALEDNLLVFSTGDIIDSLSFHGEIYNAETMEAISNGMIHLYKNINDSAPAKDIPSYFAKINEGHFHFSNLAAGTYKLFYLEDNNGNFLYDLPNEVIAFTENNIVVSDQSDSVETILRAFSFAEEKQFLLGSSCGFKGNVHFEFNQPVKDFHVELKDHVFKKDWKILDWNENRDSLIIWSQSLGAYDSVTFILEYDGLIDTVDFKLSNRKDMNTQPLSVTHNYNGFGNYFKKQFEFEFSQPISSYDTSKILIIGAGDSTLVPVSQIDESLKSFELNWTLKESSTYKLQLLPKAVKSIFNVYNEDTINLNFATTTNSSLGNLNIAYDFTQSTGNGVLQVYVENKFLKEVIVKNVKGKVLLEGTKPGNYRLKYIADENNDGAFTAGDYWTKKQSERVYWYNEKINLRANWDLDVEWTLIP